MSVVLRPYQEKIVNDTRRALKVHRKVLLVMPTGAGKTQVAGYMLGETAKRNKRCWFVVHRRELVSQTCATLDKGDIDYGIVAAGFPFQPYKNVTVCSVQTLAARLDRVPPPDLIAWDEAHHCSAGTWRKVSAQYPNALNIGLTATPERLDGRGLSEIFNALVPGPSVSWLIENKFLAPYRVWSHSAPDMKGIKKIGGDYAQDELAEAMDKPHLVGDVVAHYKKIAPGTQAIAFCVSIEHANHTAQAFRDAGISCEELDGTASRERRGNVIDQFRRGEIRVLTGVDLFSEGFDLPSLQTVILMRPTASLGLMSQQVGRALRPKADGGHALILDHAGNIARHGLPDAEREWSLEGRKKKTKGNTETPVKICPNCFGSVKAAVAVCPHCQFTFPIQPRTVEEIAGELMEVDVEAARERARIEQRSARTYEDLVALGRSRNYKAPEAWARHLIKARGGAVR